jgi:hypothetical protein
MYTSWSENKSNDEGLNVYVYRLSLAGSMYVVSNMNTHTDSPPRKCSELILSSFVRTVTYRVSLCLIQDHEFDKISCVPLKHEACSYNTFNSQERHKDNPIIKIDQNHSGLVSRSLHIV